MRLFSSIAATYELANHVMTLGLDMVWRYRAVRIATDDGGTRWLDICTGTGEMARLLARNVSKRDEIRLLALDRNREMLATAARKQSTVPIRYIEGDVYCLPFPDGTFDLVTISFAARTLATEPDRLRRVFSEVYRVIAPGGRFVVVDTSQPTHPVIRWLFHQYVALVAIPVGTLISGSRSGYACLARSIPRFPDAETLAEILGQSGFARITYRRMLFGAATIHRAVKAH